MLPDSPLIANAQLTRRADRAESASLQDCQRIQSAADTPRTESAVGFSNGLAAAELRKLDPSSDERLQLVLATWRQSKLLHA